MQPTVHGRPVCATSLAEPSRSSSAISETCRLAGTARAGGGTAAAVCCASPSLSASNTAFVISSTNNGMPSVRSTMSRLICAGSGLLPVTPSRAREMFHDMRRLAVVAFVLITLSSASQGQTEENRGSVAYLLPLCKTWLDFVEKEAETVRNMARTEPVRLTGAGVCVGFVVGVLETLRTTKLSCPPQDISNPQLVRTVLSEIEKHPDWMQKDFIGPVREVIIRSWPCRRKKGPHRIGSARHHR
jgi:hypothetical protein